MQSACGEREVVSDCSICGQVILYQIATSQSSAVENRIVRTYNPMNTDAIGKDAVGTIGAKLHNSQWVVADEEFDPGRRSQTCTKTIQLW